MNQQWAIFLTVHHAMRVVYGPSPDPWSKGGHCAASAMIGATLAELVMGVPCVPHCGAARITLPSGEVFGYTEDAVEWSRGRYHSWFVADGAPVDLRLCLVPTEITRMVVKAPDAWPLFVWGALPPWLALIPQAEATRILGNKVNSLKRTPLYTSFLTAARLVQDGAIVFSGALLGIAIRQFLKM